MSSTNWKRTLVICAGLAVLGFADAHAQACSVTDAARGMIPDGGAPDRSYGTIRVTGAEGASVPLGVGHLHYLNQTSPVELPPGAFDWLQGVAIPLSSDPDVAPTTWIADGWLLADDEPPKPFDRRGLVETGYEDASFIVLEARPDGWLRLRYVLGDGDVGTGWTHACALPESPVTLEFAEWGDWFMSGMISPLFYRSGSPGALHSAPSQNASRLPGIASDYILEPLEIRGEWMRVTVKEPSDYCYEPDTSPREGWVRWYEPASGPLLWYYTRGC